MHACNNMNMDYTDSLPDECLALIFSLLTNKNDRNNSSLVSHRWLRVEARSRTRLSLYARAGLKPLIPSIFTRFNSLAQLVLSSTYNTKLNNNDIILITSMCPKLTTLKLYKCKQLIDSGMAVFSKNCKKLKNFSCAGCGFSYIGLAALLDNSSQLEVLSVERLGYYHDVKANSCKVINLGNSKNLKRLKLSSCTGNLDRLLETIRSDGDNYLVEVHLENVHVTDAGVSSLSRCRDLIELYIRDIKCTNIGLISVAENCKALKKLYIGYSNIRRSQIGDEGLIAVGKHSVNLEKLTLSSVGASCASLQVIATNCRKLISLHLFWCERVTKAEMISFAEKYGFVLKIRCSEASFLMDN